MLRIVLYDVPRVGRSYEDFPDGFELHFLQCGIKSHKASELKSGTKQVS